MFILVLNWNGKEDTLECLRSLSSVTYEHTSTVLIDNGSTDDSIPAVRREFPELVVLENRQNLGFAGGNNVGIRYALEQGADYILLLNNDTEVDPRFIDFLVAAAEIHPDAAMLAPKIYYHSDPSRIWYAGASWHDDIMNFQMRGADLIDDGTEYSQVAETDIAVGCALFARATAIARIGLMHEEFFLLHEESDWCYRAKRAGYKIVFVPDSKIWHKVSVSFGGSDSPLTRYFEIRNRLLWVERNRSFWQLLRLSAQTLWTIALYPLRGFRPLDPPVLRRLIWTVRENRANPRQGWRDPVYRAYVRGTRDYVLRRFGDCPDVIRKLRRPGA